MGARDYKLYSGHLLMEKAVEPVDIMWKNVSGVRGVFFFRRVLLNVLAFFTLVFLSTPTAVVSALRKVDFLKLFDFDWTEKLPYGQLLHNVLPALTILLINQILLLLIDFVAILERQISHSRFQSSIFGMAVVYLNLNMLVIPGISLTTAKSFYKLVSSEHYRFKEILSDFYIADSGFFFVSLLVQQACLSSTFYLLRGGELITSYFSPWLADYKRKYLNDQKPWRRKEDYCF